MGVNKKIISKFTGLKTIIGDPKELEDGTPQDSLNWLTGSKGDHIELRMGTKLLGQTRINGIGKITGLKVGIKPDGTEIPFFTYGCKIKYYNEATDDVVEVGTDVLPAEANGEDISIENYNNIAGSFVYISSLHSGAFKIPVANPGDVVNQALDNRGYIKIKQNRGFLWNNLIKSTGFLDKTGLGVSYVDKASTSSYTAVTGESVGTGDGNTLNWTGQLLARNGARTVFNIIVKSGGSVSTVSIFTHGNDYRVNDILTIQGGDFNAQIKVTAVSGGLAWGLIDTFTVQTAGSGYAADPSAALSVSGGSGQDATFYITAVTTVGETFLDDKNGNLVGSNGGTGTINYATGAYSVTFKTAPSAGLAITANYLWEDATSQGVLDFTLANGYFRQDDGGGAFQNLFAIEQNIICLHELKSWSLILDATITNSTNLPYRDKVNIPYWRAGDETDDGIIALFIGDLNFPKLAMLSYGQYTTTIVPTSLSDDMDFTPYGVDYPVVKRWGNYDLLSMQEQTNGVNNEYNGITFARNLISEQFDKLDFNISVSDSYKGQLIAGDSLSNNVFILFSGYDDDGQVINNYWVSNQSDLDIEGLKKATFFRIDGFIAKDQNFDIYAQYDNGTFILIGNIDGQGSYVDLNAGTIIGSDTIGMQVIGGGSVPNAYHFRLDIKANTPIFEEVTIKFVANAIGALQINEYGFVDTRFKGNKALPIYNQ